MKSILAVSVLAGLSLGGNLQAADDQKQNANPDQSQQSQTQPLPNNPNNAAVGTKGQVDPSTQTWLKKSLSSGNLEIRLGFLAQQKGSDQAVKEFGKLLAQDHQKMNTKLTTIATRQIPGFTLNQQSFDSSATQPGASGTEAERSRVGNEAPTDPNAPSPTGKENAPRRTTEQNPGQAPGQTPGQPQDPGVGRTPATTPGTPGTPGTVGAPGTDRLAQALPISSEHQAIYDRLSRLQTGNFDQAFIAAVVDAHQKDIQHFENGQRTITNPELKAVITEGLPHLRHHLQMAQQIQARIGQDSQNPGLGTNPNIRNQNPGQNNNNNRPNPDQPPQPPQPNQPNQ